MNMHSNWAVVVPMANEEADFHDFIEALSDALNSIGSGTAYFVIDNASRDRTLGLCRQVSREDSRYITVFAPENRNMVDAYRKGLQTAYDAGHDIVIEMDAGLSHDPKALPVFLRAFNEGKQCVFGSRYMPGGSIVNSPLQRRMLSRTGTILSTVLLGTRLHDMTSGYQGFHRDVVAKIIRYDIKSKAHFYQTELRYLLRNYNICEVPIRYSSPSPRVSRRAIRNACEVLLHYSFLRLRGKAQEL